MNSHLAAAIEEFNRGDYLKAAELFESAAAQADDADKTFIIALNRVAAGFHLRFERGGRQAAINLFSQAMLTLDQMKPSRAGMREEFEGLLDQTSDLYARALKAGIPAEDARFVLPNAAPTNFHVMVNFAEMLHICDLRLCVRAQWEIRRMVALMRAEIKRVLPEIAVFLQPKCGENRMGYCDESLDEYLKCPISKVRPHKAAIFEMYEKYGSRKSKPLSETEFRVVEEVETLDQQPQKP